MDHGFFLTLRSVRRQLAAMPCDLYDIRLIHSRTHRADPMERIGSAGQVLYGATISRLRRYNCEGFDIYFHPFAADHNAGYILVDLDHAELKTFRTMRAQGHSPCVLLQSSPTHWQAWVRASLTPLEPAVATAIGKQLARTYGGDRASTDWRHLGRLAGFTNQKPARRSPGGYPPWVKLLYAHSHLAPQGAALVQAAQHQLSLAGPQPDPGLADGPPLGDPDPSLTPAAAVRIYSCWLLRLRIPQRFPQPDWSIADLWIARDLLARRIPLAQVHAILQLGSPGFPRRHSDPQDYLRRTLARAARERPHTAPFSG